LPGEADIAAWYAAGRAVHFGACLVLLGVFVFDRFVAAPAARPDAAGIERRWRVIARCLAGLAWVVAWLSGLAWFGGVAMDMSGLALREAIKGDTAWLVWDQTQFGHLWKWRAAVTLGILLVAPAALALRPRSLWQVVGSWTAMLLAAALVASLACAGHGQTGGPVALHLGADAVHLLVSGCWPAGLLPLALLMISIRRSADSQWRGLPVLVGRFSTMALGSVVLLGASGLVNAWCLVGTPSHLISTTYGWVLLAKVSLFCGMVVFGAVNLLRLKPRLARSAAAEGRDAIARRLFRNVIAEMILAAAVLAAVGILGLLPPPAEHMQHEHHHVESAEPFEVRVGMTYRF